MADWTAPKPADPPGPTRTQEGWADVNSPGWKEWLDTLVPPRGGQPPEPVKSVSMDYHWAGSVILPVEGDDPGPWTPDKRFEMGEGENYHDWTRYRRLYPWIKVQRYSKLEVLITVTYEDGTVETLDPKPTFLYPKGEPLTRHLMIYRWAETSGWVEVGHTGIGGKTSLADLTKGPKDWGWDDILVPSPEDFSSYTAQAGFFVEKWGLILRNEAADDDHPPKKMLPLKPKLEKKIGYVLEDGGGMFAMLSPSGGILRGARWIPVGPEKPAFEHWAAAARLRETGYRRPGIDSEPEPGRGRESGINGLEGLEGIGREYAMRLEALGVTTVSELARLEVQGVEIAGVSTARLGQWRTMAALSVEYPELSGNDVEVLAKLGVESRGALERGEVEVTSGGLESALKKAKLPRRHDSSRLKRVLGL